MPSPAQPSPESEDPRGWTNDAPQTLCTVLYVLDREGTVTQPHCRSTSTGTLLYFDVPTHGVYLISSLVASFHPLFFLSFSHYPNHPKDCTHYLINVFWKEAPAQSRIRNQNQPRSWVGERYTSPTTIIQEQQRDDLLNPISSREHPYQTSRPVWSHEILIDSQQLRQRALLSQY